MTIIWVATLRWIIFPTSYQRLVDSLWHMITRETNIDNKHETITKYISWGPSQTMPSSTLFPSCTEDGGLETSYTRVHGTSRISTMQVEE